MNVPTVANGQRPEALPHGLLVPPEPVLAIVAREKAKFPPDVFTHDVEARMTTDLTLQYHYDGLGHDVVFRDTPQGPEVLAVGVEEIHALRKGLDEGAWRALKTWMF